MKRFQNCLFFSHFDLHSLPSAFSPINVFTVGYAGYVLIQGDYMKTLILSLLLISFGAQAAINDFECEFTSNEDNQVLIEVERSFNAGSKRITVTQTNVEDQEQDQFTYFTMARMDLNRNRIEYFGGGIDFEIDLWPDTRPRFGRRYRADFSSLDIDLGQTYFNITCQYTGF